MACVFKHKNGVYYVKFRQDGRWFYRSLKTRNRRVAMTKKGTVEKKIQAGVKATPRRGGDITYRALQDAYEAWAEGQRRPVTIESRARTLRAFPVLSGAVSVAKTTPDHIEQFKRAMLKQGRSGKKGVAPRTVNEALGALRAAVYRAIRQKWCLGPNPFGNVEFLPEPKRRPRWLDGSQITTLLECAELHGRNAHLFCALGVYAGLRKGEILSARWSWFDLKAGLVHVVETDDWKPKTGNRTLPLHKKLREVLMRYRQQPEPADYLIQPEKEVGEWRYRFEIRKTFASVVKAAGLSAVSPHVLRHTFASQLVSAGVELYKVSQWLGHKDFRTTQIYAHLRTADEDINRF